MLSRPLLQTLQTESISKQIQANEVGDKAFRAMGNPKEGLIVADADVDRFVQEVDR